MLIESTLGKAALAGLSRTVKSAACVVGKQALERGAKEALDRTLALRLSAPLGNLSLVEQALFAIQPSKEERRELDRFWASPDFGSFIRSISILSLQKDPSVSEQEAALATFLARVLPNSPDGAVASLSAAIIEYLQTAAPDAWHAAADIGILGQPWAAESIIQSLVADHVANARNQLEQRVAASAASFREIDVFADRYQRAVHFSNSRLRPQSINESPAVPISDLYVEPLVNFVSEKGIITCDRKMLFASSRRSVLLGNPGGGKSTLAGKLCFDICAGTINDDEFEVPRVAAQVVLRDFAAEQRVRPCSIIEYLEEHCKSEFQIEPPTGAFKLLLLSGRILIVFDGLDELIEIKDRSDVCSAVEHFAHEYPVSPILVTSREVGYEQAPLDRARFAHFRLSPFGDSQVEEYAEKWFKYSCNPNPEEGRKLAAAFVSESAVVPDIRSNPLMLGLLCNLYRQDGFIPKNRPDVYQRCADLLFTKWDRSRGIRIKLPLDHRLRPAMSFLAQWIYSDEKLQSGVTEERLVSETSKYLRQWVEDDAEAESIATEFVGFFSGRAWVFTDTGSDKTQRLYQFTHRTFLEYFAADELVRLHTGPKELHRFLIRKIRTRSWDVVCQLAYQIAAQRAPSSDLLVELLCKDSSGTSLLRKLNVLSFLARTMNLLYPTPHARREAVRLCVEAVYRNIGEIEKGGERYSTLAREILEALCDVTDEALKTNASEVGTTLCRIITSPDLSPAARVDALLLSTDLTNALNRHAIRAGREDLLDFWRSQSVELAEKVSKIALELAETDERAAILLWIKRAKSSVEILKSFGPMALVGAVQCPIVNWFFFPIVLNLMGDLMAAYTAREEGGEIRTAASLRAEQDAIALRDALTENRPESSQNTKTTRLRASIGFFSHFEFLSTAENLRWPEDRDLSESALVCLALACEMTAAPTSTKVPEGRSRVVLDAFAFAYSRTFSSYREEAHKLIDRLSASKKVADILHGWVNEEFSFSSAGGSDSREANSL